MKAPVDNITFKADGHTYTVNSVDYPSVTRVIADSGMYGNAAAYFTEHSRERGAFVHQIIKYDVDGELDESSVDEALAGYFDAWKRFRAESGYEPEWCEKVLASTLYGFAGTVDHVGLLNGHPAIIDTKTGAVMPATAIQTGGYEILVKKPGIRRFGLQLMADGKYRLTEFRDRQDSKIFLAALSVYYWKRNNRIAA